MTLPEERTRSILNTRDFLMKLLMPPTAGGYKRVPKDVRQAAKRLLKNYPCGPYEIGK